MSATVGKAISQTGSIEGAISNVQRMKGQLAHEGHLIGSLATAYSSIGVKYEGDYEVTPTVEGLELETRDKYMTDNVTIRKIPFYEVSNTSGGSTVYIAGEIEME